MRRQLTCILRRIARAALSIAVVLALLTADMHAADRTADNSPVQRIYVPADEPSDWPRDKSQHYLPMSADDFEKNLDRLRNGNRANALAIPQLASADYTAALSGDCLVRGEAKLRFDWEGAEPHLALLGDCKLPVSEPRWIGGELAAVVGNDSQGRLGVLVERSGLLGWSWSLRGQPAHAGETKFDLTWPACPATTLHLNLPANCTLESSAGIVTLETSHGSDRQWRVQLGGQNRTTLQVTKTDSTHPQSVLVLAEALHAYDLSLKGVVLTARLDLDVVEGPVRRITLQADRDLQLISARIGDGELGVSRSTGDRAGFESWTIDFPQPVPVGKHSVEIAAVAPIVLDKTWQLPKVSLPSAHWVNGRAILRRAASLQLSDLTCEECNPTAARRDQANDSEQIEFQCLTESSEIKLIVSRPQGKPQVSTSTSITLGPSEVAAQCVAKVSMEEGGSYSVEADVPAQWIIDSLESNPAGRVASWTHEALPGRGGKLRVQLQTPLARDHALHLNINARRRRVLLSEKLGPNDLEPLKFVQMQPKLQLLSLNANEPYQLQLDGAESLHYVDADQLKPADADLSPKRASGITFLHDDAAQDLVVSLALKSPRYAAQIRTRAIVADEILTESSRFSIAPEGRDVSRLVVRFSQPRAEALTWSIDGSAEGLSCRRLSESEQPAAPSGDTELWEINLSSPRSKPFELVAVREIPLKADMPVALASLIGAESQVAEVDVESVGQSWPEVRTSRRLKAFSLELQPADQIKNILGRFHYSEEDTLAAQEPPLVIATSDDRTTQKSAWVWEASLESRYYRGESEQVFTAKVENEGRPQIAFQLPRGAMLLAATLNDAPVEASSSKAEEAQVRLSRDARFATVVLVWTNDDSDEGLLFSARTPPWPVCDVPILRRQWRVALAPENALVEAEIAGQSVVELPWSRRLFGFLSRQRPNVSIGSGEHSVASADAGGGMHLTSPWKTDNTNLAATAGWTIYRFDDSPVAPSWIRFANRRRVMMEAIAILFLTLGLRWWLGRLSSATSCMILAVATAVALLVPAAIVSFTSAIWMGIVAAQTGLFVYRARPAANRAKPEERVSWTTVVSGSSLLLLLAVISCQRGAWAEEAEQHSDAFPAGRHVLIPVDEKRQPSGGRVYLPKAFYDQLLSAIAGGQLDSPQYLIENARYLATDPLLADETASNNWQARFKIHLLAERATVRLPLGADGTSLVADSIELDGEPIAVDQDVQRGSIAVEIKKPGHHDLAIGFRAPTKNNTIDFAIPPVANADVEFPARWRDSVGVDTLGAPLDISGGNQLRAMLGPTKRVLIHAAAANSSAATSAVFDSRELYRVRVDPGAILVTARFQIHVHEGQLRELHLFADRRLRPLHVPEAQNIAILEADNNLRETIVTLPQPISDALTIDIPMLLEDADSPIRMPELKLLGSRNAQRWWGIDADSALELSATEISAKIAPSEFTEAWGDADWKPQICFGAGSDNVSLSFQFRTSTSSAKYRLALFVGEESVSVLARADISTGSGLALFDHVSIPRDMQIDDVEASDSSGLIPTRWERIASDRLAIQLGSSPTGTHSVTIRGRIARHRGDEEAVPQIKVENCDDQGFQVVVARSTKVLVSVLSPQEQDLRIGDASDTASLLAAFRQEGLTSGAERAGEWQPVAVLDSPRGFRSVALQVTPNRPKVKAVQVTSLSRSGDAWKATVDLDLQITGGLVDLLRLAIPAEWGGPWEIEPSTPSSIVESLGSQQRELVISPEAPLSGPARLRISGPLTLSPGQRPAIPEVQMMGPYHPAQFILLPRQLDGQQLEWDRRGLVARGVPEGVSVSVSDRSSYRSFQTFGSRYRATLRSADPAAEKPRVLLEDVALRFNADGQCSGVASFDLEPAGATSCQFNLPEKYTLLQVTLDGVAAPRTDVGENRFNIWLGDNKLPRRLQAVFTGTVPLPRPAQTLTAPFLSGMPAERTLWTLSAPDSAGRIALNASEQQTNSDQEVMRLQAWIELAESAARLFLEESSEELRDWYAPWLARIVAGRAELAAAERAGNNSKRSTLDDRIRALDQQQARLVERLQATAIVKQLSDEAMSASEPSDLWALEPSAERLVAFAATGNSPELVAGYPERHTGDFRWRLAVAVSVLGLAGLVLTRRRLTEETQERPQSGYAPYLAGLCIAAIWLLWLTPAFLGFVIAAASAYGAAQRYRRGTSAGNAHIGTSAAI